MIPPREPFAAAVREALEDHTDWDSPHHFTTLHWDGERLTPYTVVVIMQDIDAAEYPAHMAAIAAEELREHPGDPAYAYLLQFEAFGMPDGLGTHERPFREQPEAIECAVAYCADIHGRLWTAGQQRGESAIAVNFYPPGPRQPTGRAIHALLTVAEATGHRAYGLPSPAMRN